MIDIEAVSSESEAVRCDVACRTVSLLMSVCALQLMSAEEHNGPGFYYVVRWRRHDLAPTAKFEERPVDRESNVLVVDGQSVYKPYEMLL